MILIMLIPLAAFFYGLFLLIFLKGKRQRGFKVILISIVGVIGTGIIIDAFEGQSELNKAARLAGFENHQDRQEAEEYEIFNGDVWARDKKEIISKRREQIALEVSLKKEAEKQEKQKAEQLKLEKENERKAEADRIARQKIETEKREKAENLRKGFHCLSSWDGSHREFKVAVKKLMRDPDSFEHIETRVTPVDEDGMHTVLMKYRARNGFGGMNVGDALGKYSNQSCQHVVIQIE